MKTFNLLPWREELKTRKKNEYLVFLGICVFFGLITWLLGHIYYDSLVSHQTRKNDFLKKQISLLDAKIIEIRELERKRENLITRMTTVEELQASRHFIVRLFDEMTKALPDGVYLTALEQKENRIELTGIAQSNARVSNFMRNIEESPWLENPKLSIIETAETNDTRISTFTLTFNLAKNKSLNLEND